MVLPGCSSHADGSRLLVVSNSGDIGVLDLFGGTKLGRPVAWDPAGCSRSRPTDASPRWSSAVDNDVALIDVGTGRVRPRTAPGGRGAPHFDRPVLAAFSPDGARVAVGSAASDGQPAEIEIFSTVDGRSERRLHRPGCPVHWRASWRGARTAA